MNKLSNSQFDALKAVREGKVSVYVINNDEKTLDWSNRWYDNKLGLQTVSVASLNALVKKGLVVIVNGAALCSDNWRLQDNTSFDDSDFDNWPGAVTTSAQSGGATTDIDLTWLLSDEDIAFNKTQ